MNRRLATTAATLTGALLMSNPSLAQDRDQADASLYDRLGGLMPISVVVSDFLDQLIPDPQLNENPAIDAARQRVPASYLKYRVTAFVCEATGGPCEYTGRGMRSSHAHLNITAGEWQRMLSIFQEVLADHDVPQRETRELVALVQTTRDAIVTGD